MDWEKLLIELIYALVTFVIIPLISWGLYELRKHIARKTENQCRQHYLNQALDIIEKSVIMVAQTYVFELKAKGKFDEKAQKEALKMAYFNAKKLMTPKIQELIVKTYGDFDTWLVTAIEAKVNTMKNNNHNTT